MGIDVYRIAKQKDAEGEWYLQVNGDPFKAGATPNKFPGATATFHAITPSGKFLCGKQCGAFISGCHPAEALKEWMKLPESERKPGAVSVPDLKYRDPFAALPPSGTLVLKAFQSVLHRDAQGELFRQKYLFPEAYKQALRYEPGRDYVWLTEAQWKSIVPNGVTKGKRFPLPTEVAEEILFSLRDTSQSMTYPSARWGPRNIRSKELTLEVEEVSSAIVRLRLEGSVHLRGFVREGATFGEAYYEASVLGYLEFDAKRKEFTRFDLVTLGDHQGWGVGNAATRLNELYVLGVAFEIARGGCLAQPSTQFG